MYQTNPLSRRFILWSKLYEHTNSMSTLLNFEKMIVKSSKMGLQFGFVIKRILTLFTWF